MKKFNDRHDEWATAGPVRIVAGGQTRWHWHREGQMLEEWASCINEKLVGLGAMLSNSKSLEEFSLEASSEVDGEKGPRWDYLHDSTIRSLISNLPSSLNNLTLDMCGSRAIAADRDRSTIHLCPLIANRLHDRRYVRLRMRRICPQVLETSSYMPDVESSLKTLVIKLSLPSFPEAVNEVHNGHTEFDAESCVVTAIPLHKRMIAAGAAFAKSVPGMSMMRVLYRSQSDTDVSSSYNLAVADCVRERYLFDITQEPCYEDNGRWWGALEDSENLQDAGGFEELLW